MARWLSSCFPSTRKNKRTLQHPTPIAIRTQSIDNHKSTNAAILTYDSKAVSSIISQQLVTEVLREHYNKIDEHNIPESRMNRYGEEIDGYVYLDWCWESNQKQWHNTRFFVTNTCDPPYDAVLGRKDAEYYGMMKTPRKR